MESTKVPNFITPSHTMHHGRPPAKAVSPSVLLPEVRVLEQNGKVLEEVDSYNVICDPYFFTDRDAGRVALHVRTVAGLAKPHEGLLPDDDDANTPGSDTAKVSVVCLSYNQPHDVWNVTNMTVGIKFSHARNTWQLPAASDQQKLARGVYPGAFFQQEDKVCINMVKFADRELLLALPIEHVSPYLLVELDSLKKDDDGVINLVKMQLRGSGSMSRWGQTAVPFSAVKYKELFGIDMRIPSNITSPVSGGKNKGKKRSVAARVLDSKLTILAQLDAVFLDTQVCYKDATTFMNILKSNVTTTTENQLARILVEITGAKENDNLLHCVMESVVRNYV